MDFQEVMTELEAVGNEQTKKTLIKHGAREPFFGVKVSDLKKIVKKIKKDHNLSLELYNSGNSDAMYLAGLISDENQITKEQLNDWAEKAYWYYISEFTVPWVAAESNYGWELALEWIESDTENIASCGWATLRSLTEVKPDEDLNIDAFSALLDRVKKEIQSAPNRVRYTMNGFVIAVGSYISGLTQKAIKTGEIIGTVEVDMGGTACKVPSSPIYIDKVKKRGSIGKKRKTARC
ncbi:MAG: DNA alkylation repair protein [Bacteroidetes bacterium]|nr:MAG: DNA alkylation repair protein [Bacteroidota bacterium]